MIKKILTSFGFLILFISCNNTSLQVSDSEYSTKHKPLLIDTEKWFLGTWYNINNEEKFTEIWQRLNDSVFVGKGFVIIKLDTVFYEDIILEEVNDIINYTVSTKNKNNEMPVSFKLIKYDSNQLIFENQTHDFPTKITYNKITPDSIVAEISGNINGKEKKEFFCIRACLHFI